MEIPILQIDAFTSQPFKGNPAAVCLLSEKLPDEWMQQVAAEMNLSETAFVQPRAGGDGFSLRWFTPTLEIALCGHATLASAHALYETGWLGPREEARFHTQSGQLSVQRKGKLLEMNFPALPVRESVLPKAVQEALGALPRRVCRAVELGNEKNFLLELADEKEVRNLKPDFGWLREVAKVGIIVTARATTPPFDFVSRYFAGYAGIDEDPVTGAAHCSLAPYWAKELGRTELIGYQASARGGVVRVRHAADRVLLAGEAVTVLRGILIS